jgi:hypothetical protein
MRGRGVVNATLRQLYLREIDLVPILQGGRRKKRGKPNFVVWVFVRVL